MTDAGEVCAIAPLEPRGEAPLSQAGMAMMPDELASQIVSPPPAYALISTAGASRTNWRMAYQGLEFAENDENLSKENINLREGLKTRQSMKSPPNVDLFIRHSRC